jgi:hypothetical protein
MDVSVLGIRHHGPGSARSVRGALAALAPDLVLIEGPPEADAIAALAADPEMTPPVALVAYVPDAPARAAIYPFAVFSPEWQALRHAQEREVPVRFIDLPMAHVLAGAGATEDEDDDERPHDPLGLLAAAAGYQDAERWWEDLVELRADDEGAAFAAVAEAMAALREETGPATGREARREAAMRQAIRAADKAGHDRVAVVCGAWHAPVLDPAGFPPASHDAALLRGLPKAKVATTWVPWTHDRLALDSGYGAGVTAPGWYHHLFTAPDAILARWLRQAAVLLRAEGHDVSPAAIIEAVRMAEALAALRERPRAGLPELDDAALAVLCGGNPLLIDLLGRRLTVGDVLGAVPAATPMVPVAEDLERRRRALRLRQEVAARELDLDLRRDLDLERSRLLHRLTLLDVPWGRWDPAGARGARGTFHEIWSLAWDPGLAVRLIDAGRYGRTVAEAATTRAGELAASADGLPELGVLLEACLLADLPEAVRTAMRALDERAAGDGDVGRLMDALGPLARVSRYGDVRRADVSAVTVVVEGLIARVCAGLGPACTALGDEAAATMRGRLDTVQSALAALDREDLRATWLDALAALAGRDDVHGLLAGRATRVLLDAGRLQGEEAGRPLSRALSVGEDPARGAAWLEGFLAGSGLLLLHDPPLLALIDAWIARIDPGTFDDLLPLLRRAFAAFPHGERRQIGEAARRIAGGAAPSGPAGGDDDLDPERVEAVLGLLRRILTAPEGGA